MTLVEMMVSISIFSIAIIGFSILFIRSWKVNSYTIEMGQSSFVVSRSVDNLVTYLRKIRQGDNGAYAIELADDNELIVYSDYDKSGDADRLHIYLENSQLKMGVTKPIDGIPKIYPTGDQQTIILAERIVNTPADPIFYYYDEKYPSAENIDPIATPANIAKVRLMKIFLKINIDPNRDPDNVEMQSFVEFRNLNDYN